jgi:LacI family transcriptional regulator
MAPKDVQKSVSDQERVTIRTVAADAGVSVAAVSKVLRNAYGVSDGLRARVLASIARLNYRPRTAARGLRGRTFTVGILLTDLHNPFLPQIIDGANSVLDPSHYQSLMGVGQANLPMETALIESMIDHNMDGLMLIAPRLSPDVVAGFARRIPIVCIAHHTPNATSYDTVNADDLRGAEIAVEALLALGHRDIAMLNLSGYGDIPESVQSRREAGYSRAMERAGLTARQRIIRTAHTTAQTKPEIDMILAAADRPRAVFCWSDLDALHVLSAAARLGLRVPQDLAVVGFDNSSVAALPQVNLASIDQSGQQLGQTATRLLLERIEGRPDPRHVLLEPKLVMRGSAQPD